MESTAKTPLITLLSHTCFLFFLLWFRVKKFEKIIQFSGSNGYVRFIWGYPSIEKYGFCDFVHI